MTADPKSEQAATAEGRRLEARSQGVAWNQWGPYLSSPLLKSRSDQAG